MSTAALRALGAACLISALVACGDHPTAKNTDADWLARQEKQDLEAARNLYGPEGPPTTAAEAHARHDKTAPKTPTVADVHAAHHAADVPNGPSTVAQAHAAHRARVGTQP